MNASKDEDCLTCRSVSGQQRISPGVTIHDGQYWMVEHAYPTLHRGWLVIVLKRHCQALHELTPAEFQELGELQARTVQLLRATFEPEKEYLMCLAEKAGFRHIHMHVIQRPADLPEELIGTRIFSQLAVTAEQAAPSEEIAALCAELHTVWER